MKQTDQSGNKIPDDLVVLPDIDNLFDGEIKTIEEADWYDVYISMNPDGNRPTIYLMASARAIDYLEASIDLDELGGIPIEALKVDDRLKRWSFEDGFYHS